VQAKYKNANVAHGDVTEADASESMIPLSNAFHNRIKPKLQGAPKTQTLFEMK
jgi:hypothetical protein